MRHIKEIMDHKSCLFSQNQTAPFPILMQVMKNASAFLPRRAEASSPLRGGNPHKTVITDAYFVTHVRAGYHSAHSS